MSYFTSKYEGAGSDFNEEDEKLWQKMNSGLPQGAPPSAGIQNQGMDAGSLGSAAAAGGAMGGPAGAGIAVGGQFLSQYLSQRAAAEKQKRQNAVDIEQEYTKGQNNNLTNLLSAYRGALR